MDSDPSHELTAPDLKDQLQRTLGNTCTIERELGGGGMSRVFVAEETALGRKIVVKVLPPDLAASVNVDRFRREIQLSAKLQHPHIVPVLAAGVSEDLPYYTMPFIEGESLRAKLSRSGELPVPEATRILREVLSALSYAHERGVVHRDIKPDNILLTGGHAVVADFGVAKALSASATASSSSSITSLGVALGTPAYMSPEQAVADPSTDHRADLYSVGAMAYEMLTGQQVFSARSPQAMLAAHAIEKPEPIDKRRSSVPPGLSSLIMRSLEKHAADRPQSAAEMLAELEAAVTPSGATTPHMAAIKPKAEKSDKRSVVMAMGLALVLLTLASSTWYWYESKSDEETAAAADVTPSIAVLPFENLGQPDDSYFVDGMTEEISSRLGSVSGLRLIGRQSAKAYANTAKPIAQIGKELGVAYLLTGSVRWDRSRAGQNEVKVTPALLRASDGVQMWSEPYQDNVTSVFEIQGKVAGHVAQALQIQLTQRQQQELSSRPTNNPAAYDLYLRARAIDAMASGNPAHFVRAIGLFERAIEADPAFAPAYAGLARAHLGLYWFRGDASARRVELAKAAVDKALALDPNLPDAHLALAYYYYHGKLDYARALDAVRAVQRLSRNDAGAIELEGLLERRQNRWPQAIAAFKRAAELDPRLVENLETLCESQHYVRDHAGAEQSCSKVLTVAPGTVSSQLFIALSPLLKSGDSKQTLAMVKNAAREFGAEDVATDLMSPDRREIWPGLLDEDLARHMAAVWTRFDGSRRFGYFTSALILASYQKNSALARQMADSIIVNVPKYRRGNFFDSELYSSLALAYAAKGDRTATLREAKRAMDLLPHHVDAVRGAANLHRIALATVLVGAHDEAFATLKQLLSVASPYSAASIKVDPWYEPLRQDPRFAELTAGR